MPYKVMSERHRLRKLERAAVAARKAARAQRKAQAAEFTAVRKANAAQARADREAAGPKAVARYDYIIRKNREAAARRRAQLKALRLAELARIEANIKALHKP